MVCTEVVVRIQVRQRAVRIEIDLQAELGCIEEHSTVAHIEVAVAFADYVGVAAVGHSYREPRVLLAGLRIDFRNYFAAMKLP